jgi:mono/diheme cytochrome c family protein
MRFLQFVALGLTMALAVSACTKSNTSTSSSETSNAEGSSAPIAATSAAATTAAASAGETAYTANCASCHQANGKGLTGSFPPLAGNPVVTGDPKKVIRIVKYGLSGKIMVGPDSFNGIMPPWATQLSDDAVAGVVTFIRTSWGNKASAVTTAEVGAVKK